MRKRCLSLFLLRLSVLPLWAAGQAMAHHLPPGMEEVDEFADEAFSAALTHPLSGLDHWLAAMAVGLTFWVWGKKTGFQSTALFVMALAAGTMAGRAGLQMPLMETGLAVSVILAGCVIAGAKWFSSRIVLSLATLTGAWHGMAHGLEMPAAAPAGLYTLGLTIGSGLIAIAAGSLATQLPDVQVKPALPRWTGRALAALGAALLVTTLAS